MADSLKSSLFPAESEADIATQNARGEAPPAQQPEDFLKMRDSVKKAIEDHHPAMLDSIMKALQPSK